MTDKKISELSSITNAELDEANDTIAIVDTSATQTKKITVSELLSNTPDLAAIAETIAKTAVAVCVYDPSLDSDPDWVKRTQNTSWHRELGPFPVPSLIIAEAGVVTIHDASDVDLPVYMEFTKGSGGYAIGDVSADITSIKAKDGKIVFGQTTSYGMIDFIKDQSLAKNGANTFTRINPLSGRNAGGGNTTTTDNLIASAAVNAVDITVLDNAPLDAETGSPVPTVPVGTGGGLSVISDSGVVYDSNKTTSVVSVAIQSDKTCTAVFSDGVVINYDLTTITADAFTGTTVSGVLGAPTSNTDGTFGSTDGLTVVTPSGLNGYITSDYNTGWMQGDTELALSDGLTDRSGSSTTVTDNGTAVISAAATGSEQKKITATGGSITAPVTTGGKIYGWEYISGVPVFRAGTGWVGVSEAAGTLTIVDGTTFAMLRYTNGAGPSAAQYAYQEETEKYTLQEDADCLLYGTSDAVTAVARDTVTDLCLAGTSDGRSDFQGLVRASDTTNAVGVSISASNGLIADE